MSNEMRGISSTGTLDARILNSSGKIWNGTTFETYSSANFSTYLTAMTEQGNSGIYLADFPTGITTGGTYEYFVSRRSGASAAETDTIVTSGKIDWTGTVSITGASGSMIGSDWRDYVLRLGFKRTDKDTELYEATTDSIQKMRRKFMFDEAEAEATTTDTITVLGDFKLTVESDLGLVLGIILEDSDTGTPLLRIPKWRFDELYPSVNVDTDKGYPKHYCLYNGQIYIGPIPDSVSYSYRISYSRRAGTVTSSTAAVPFTNLYRDVLAYDVLFRLYLGLDEPDKASSYKQLFDEGFDEITRRERVNSGSTIWNQEVFNI